MFLFFVLTKSKASPRPLQHATTAWRFFQGIPCLEHHHRWQTRSDPTCRFFSSLMACRSTLFYSAVWWHRRFGHILDSIRELLFASTEGSMHNLSLLLFRFWRPRSHVGGLSAWIALLIIMPELMFRCSPKWIRVCSDKITCHGWGGIVWYL